jgi:hypothetical protein
VNQDFDRDIDIKPVPLAELGLLTQIDFYPIDIVAWFPLIIPARVVIHAHVMRSLS